MTGKKSISKPIRVDVDEVPSLGEAFFKHADQFQGEQLKTRGRPKSQTVKEPVKLRLDADVVAALRASGEGWQTRINDALRASLKLSGSVL